MIFNNGDRVINILKSNSMIQPVPDALSKDSIVPVLFLVLVTLLFRLHEHEKVRQLLYKLDITQLWKGLESCKADVSSC